MTKRRIAVVTGATGGLGIVTARELARKGARVVMAARDRARAEQAGRAITTKASPGPVCSRTRDKSSTRGGPAGRIYVK
jgi:NAD(P)-dependent dehydrogenase (short-subunit alcohol dehydrogenase family)